MSTKKDKVKVFLIEDSPVQRELLRYILNSDSDIEVIGVAENGKDAIAALKDLMPNIVITDLHMPKLNGIETIRYIMSTNPLPIIAISASDNSNDAINSFYALEAGALAFTKMPVNIIDPHYESQRNDLIQHIKLMSEIKVVRRWGKGSKNSVMYNQSEPTTAPYISNQINVIAIGVSTGGPIVLEEIISELPNDFPPILIVQHIAHGFIQGLAEWLQKMTNHPVSVAKRDEVPKRGHVYLAPDLCHMGVSHAGTIILKQDPLKKLLCPSASFLFKTVADVFKNQAMGILLTGMGVDGALELKLMKDKGAITIAQDKNSALIYGMPGEAVSLGAVMYSLNPHEIAATISNL
jgi:two-component system chemotaxis response regulator CheB